MPMATPLFDEIYAVGDSLSDSGGIFGLSSQALSLAAAADIDTQGLQPIPVSPPYAFRFSNGPVLPEITAELLGARLINFSFGGAAALGTQTLRDAAGPAIPDQVLADIAALPPDERAPIEAVLDKNINLPGQVADLVAATSAQPRRNNAQSLARSRPAVPNERAHLALSWLPSALREKPGTSVSTPPASEAPELVDQALQQERGKTEQLSRELSVARHELSARTLALADRAALEQELVDLRHTLRQNEPRASDCELTLAQERQRGQMLEEQLIARREALTAAPAGTAVKGEEIIALREALKQAEERGVGYRQSLLAALDDKAAKEHELGTLRQALDRAATTEQALIQERQRHRALEEQLAAGKAEQEREVGFLRQTLMQVEEQLADREQLLAQERNRLEAEIVTRGQTVAMAVEPGVEGAHLALRGGQ